MRRKSVSYLEPVAGSTSTSDPCSSHPGNTAPQSFQNDLTVRANCIALGVPADGSYQQANPQISVIVGGNENLDPESSKSWVYGAVYSPSFLPGLSLEVNHYDIKVKGAIQTVNANITLTNCVVLNDPVALPLSTARRGWRLARNLRLAPEYRGHRNQGVDFNASYRDLDIGFGKLGLDLEYDPAHQL